LLYKDIDADMENSYFGDHNIEGMFATLAPLHKLLEEVRFYPDFISINSVTNCYRALKHFAKFPLPKHLVGI
jgi:hypothetical protein